MQKHKELKSFELNGVKIMVSLNYDERRISIVEGMTNVLSGEQKFVVQQFSFGMKPIEYMPEWLKIIDAIKFAVKSAQSEMNEYFDWKEKTAKEKTYQLLLKATQAFKSNKTNENKGTSKTIRKSK